jgi:carbonic anhydrase
MACDNNTGPVDIKYDSAALTCDLKCNFTYKYNTGGFNVTNLGTYLSLKLTNNDSQNVYFTSNKGIGECSNYGGGAGNYSVDEIRIYSPSLHTYNGVKADGEIVIYHNNIGGGKKLIVCIPIMSSLIAKSDASKQLTEIIKSMAEIGKTENHNMNIQGNNFNLNNFIPNDNFYTYTATMPWYPCTKCIDYIVFDNGSYAINITNETLTNLTNIIDKNEITVRDITSSIEFTYSKKKPIYSSPDSDNNIYIECNPTGSDGEILVETQKEGYFDPLSLSILSSINLGGNLIYNILYVFIFFLIIFGVMFGLSHIGSYMTCSTCSTPVGGSKAFSGKIGKKIGGGSCNIINKSNLRL